ncbi:lysosomal membrane ascorbate-dependent ferrireductase CYB561A3-like isoform X1 [Ciona intestinalis]
MENFFNGRKAFWTMVGFSQFFGLLALTLLIVWNCVYNGGFAWDGRYKEFAIHPLCMLLSVLLFGEGSLIYRTCGCFNRPTVKVLHAVIMFLAVALAVFGLITIFLFHSSMHDGNMYTMHSWLGMATIVGVIIQFLAGGILFFIPWKANSIRKIYTPIHKYGSFALLGMLQSSVLTGVLDDIFLCMSNKEYEKLNPHAVMFNVVGLLCLAFVLSVMYVIFRVDWKRGANGKNCKTKTESLLPSTSLSNETDQLLEKQSPKELNP